MNEIKKRLNDLLNSVAELSDYLKIEEKNKELIALEQAMQSPDFWQDQKTAAKISQDYNFLKETVEFWENFSGRISEALALASDEALNSDEILPLLEKTAQDLETQFHKHRLPALLNQKYDSYGAIVSIHAGAGGTDAQDWAEMILRMITRYAADKNFKTEILEMSKGGEAGIKSVTLEVTGPFAYGYLKSEAGVHRLVRQSPFNPSHTRETSFALVELLPALEEQENFQINPKDLKIEANTSSGHGGQSVNTTYSAIRITHIPTGIKVSIQNERSQHQNKELAMKILLAKLQTLEDEKLSKEKKELRGEFKSAEWGNQIRSYVLHPYQLVKDHRTNIETSNTKAVLDGELEIFAEAYLEQTYEEQK